MTVGYLKFVSNQINYLIALGAVMGLTSSACVYFFLDESPLFLIKIGKHEEAEQIILKIFRINGGQNPLEAQMLNGHQEAITEANFRRDNFVSKEN